MAINTIRPVNFSAIQYAQPAAPIRYTQPAQPMQINVSPPINPRSAFHHLVEGANYVAGAAGLLATAGLERLFFAKPFRQGLRDTWFMFPIFFALNAIGIGRRNEGKTTGVQPMVSGKWA